MSRPVQHSGGWDKFDEDGSYFWRSVDVFIDSEFKFSCLGDDGFVGGTWYDWLEPVRSKLTGLGYEVTLVTMEQRVYEVPV